MSGVKSNCEFCGISKEYKYKSFVKKYCSHSCANKASADVRKSKDIECIKCKQCDKEFKILSSVKRSRESNGVAIKYCSQSCSGKANSKKVKKQCLNCDNEFYTTRNKFCSRECSYVYRKKQTDEKEQGYWFENGYKILYVSGNKYIKEHIHVMEKHLGRKLAKDEVVHHKNEDRADNRIENLEVMKRSEHSRYHRNKELSEGKVLFKSL